VALDVMAAAVLIQRPGEGIVYANQAAADAMGLLTPEAVTAATPEEIAGGWESYNEDGTPLTADQYPSRKILTGTDLAPPPLVSRGLHRATGREQWLAVKARAVLDDDDQVVMAVSVSEDVTAVKRAELVQELLAQAGKALSSSLDVDQTLRQLARLAVPKLADWCTVSLPGDDGLFRQVAIAHRDPEKVAFAEEYQARFPSRMDAPAGSGAVFRNGGAVLMAEIPDDLLAGTITDAEQLAMLRQIGMRSVIQVPITPPAGAPLGVLNLIDADSGRVFTADDLAVAEELGRRAGVALHNACLYAERSVIATTLQDSLLPEDLPDVPGYALSATYRPAGQHTWVGGDFYDVFETSSGWMVVVGDVAGHGAEAAALTAQARYSLRSAGMLTGDVVSAVRHLNAVLAARPRLSLCTVCAVLLPDPAAGDGAARVVCAGHPLPVLVRAGHVEEVGSWGVMIGAFEDAAFSAVDVPLRAGDLLVLYTDGVLDARSATGRFGEQRLHEALTAAVEAPDAVRRIERALDGFQTGDQADDTAVLAVGRSVTVPAPRPDALSPAAAG